jgi:hypothetical protein
MKDSCAAIKQSDRALALDKPEKLGKSTEDLATPPS